MVTVLSSFTIFSIYHGATCSLRCPQQILNFMWELLTEPVEQLLKPTWSKKNGSQSARTTFSPAVTANLYMNLQSSKWPAVSDQQSLEVGHILPCCSNLEELDRLRLDCHWTRQCSVTPLLAELFIIFIIFDSLFHHHHHHHHHHSHHPHCRRRRHHHHHRQRWSPSSSLSSLSSSSSSSSSPSWWEAS